jgi:hypothetical protein
VFNALLALDTRLDPATDPHRRCPHIAHYAL